MQKKIKGESLNKVKDHTKLSEEKSQRGLTAIK